jgi:hypothetical protein
LILITNLISDNLQPGSILAQPPAKKKGTSEAAGHARALAVLADDLGVMDAAGLCNCLKTLQPVAWRV